MSRRPSFHVTSKDVRPCTWPQGDQSTESWILYRVEGDDRGFRVTLYVDGCYERQCWGQTEMLTSDAGWVKLTTVAPSRVHELSDAESPDDYVVLANEMMGMALYAVRPHGIKED